MGFGGSSSVSSTSTRKCANLYGKCIPLTKPAPPHHNPFISPPSPIHETITQQPTPLPSFEKVKKDEESTQKKEEVMNIAIPAIIIGGILLALFK
jgi:hypothetical protein